MKGTPVPETAVPPQDICERTFDYVLRAVALFNHLQQSKNRAAWTIANQYLRAATSIGYANVEETQAGESRADFSHKCAIALKESRESHYWLRLLHRSQIVPAQRLDPLLHETNELTAIVKKSKRPFRLPSLLFSLVHLLF